MVAAASPAIQKATARVMQLSDDERARLLHEYEVKAWRDEQAKLDYGIEQGIKQGRTEGRTEGRIEGRTEGLITVARNLLKMELPLTKIVDATGLSLDEIKKLAN